MCYRYDGGDVLLGSQFPQVQRVRALQLHPVQDTHTVSIAPAPASQGFVFGISIFKKFLYA